MTQKEFEVYSKVAQAFFDLMNGDINRRVNATFSIEPYNLHSKILGRAYAETRYPNCVTIYIGDILGTYEESWSNRISKYDFTCVSIAMTIAHELFHIEQKIDLLIYKHKQCRYDKYSTDIENATDRMAYDYVRFHINDFAYVAQFDPKSIDMLDMRYCINNVDYRSASTKEMYMQTLRNVILRDEEFFENIMRDEDKYQSILVNFESKDKGSCRVSFDGSKSILIKANGKYLEEYLDEFCRAAYYYAGFYDKYKVGAYIEECYYEETGPSLIIDLVFKDRFVEGVYFNN